MKSERKIEQFSRFSRRLTKEGLINALLISLAVAFSIVFVVSTVAWFVEKNVLLLCVGIVALVSLIGIPLVYFIFYRPTVQSNARRIDRLGMEERMVTMVELENEDSVLSRLQREDAQRCLAEADEKQMKLRIPRKTVLSVSIAAILGCAMTTLSALAAFGYIMSGAELLDPLIPDTPVQYVYVEYIVEEGGYIEGEVYQEIVLGESGSEVMAVADEGWIFEGWTDGAGNPVRLDQKVEQDMLLIALFVPDESADGGEGDQDGQNGSGEGQESEDGEPSDQPGDGEGEGEGDSKSNSEQEGDEDQQASSAGGKYDAANQIIDGETFYRDVFGQYDDQMKEEMSSDDDVPEDIRDIVENYFEIIG